MMKNLFKSLFIVIAVSAALGATAATNYGINVGGQEVNSDNYNRVTGGDIKSGTVSYNPSSNTLTLTDVTISRTTSGDFCVHNRSKEGLKIIFNGTCNLTSTKAHGLKFDKSTDITVSSGATVNVTSGSARAFYLGNIEVNIYGSGNLNFKTTADGDACIRGADVTSLRFHGAKVTVKSYHDYAMRSLMVTCHAGTDLTIKPNSSKESVYDCNFIFSSDGKAAILEPFNAYWSNSGNYGKGTIYANNGGVIFSQDIWISDQYVALFNSSYFPDANFRERLVSLFNKGYITTADVDNRTYLDVSDRYIWDLTGISYFTKLTKLDCHANFLTSLNLSALTKLQALICYNNRLTSLSGLASTLTSLNCSNNQLTSISLPTYLQTLNCANNKFTTFSLTGRSALDYLDIQNNTSLTTLSVNDNALTSLKVSGCSAMTTLNCYDNQLTGLNVYGCSKLATLKCYNNKLSSISNLPSSLITLECGNNQLSSISVPSSVQTLTCGKNNFSGTFTLNYRSALKTLDINGCANLTTLTVNDNALTSLNVTNCSAMTTLNCWGNKLASLNLSGCSKLATLKTYNNLLTSISNLPASLTYLDCTNNQFTSISVPTAVKELYCGYNKFTSMNFSNRSALTTLDVSNNTSLTYLNCTDNSLTTLNVTGCTALGQLELRNNRLSSVNVKNLASLNRLGVQGNRLTSLDVSGCNALRNLYITRNQISGSGMQTLVNSLCTVPQGVTADFGIYTLDSPTEEGNSITDAQLSTVRTKNWIPKKYENGAWVVISATQPGGKKGDVNNDGTIDVSDINILVNIMLGKDSASNYGGRANVDGTGGIDINDINALVNIFLNPN